MFFSSFHRLWYNVVTTLSLSLSLRWRCSLKPPIWLAARRLRTKRKEEFPMMEGVAGVSGVNLMILPYFLMAKGSLITTTAEAIICLIRTRRTRVFVTQMCCVATKIISKHMSNNWHTFLSIYARITFFIVHIAIWCIFNIAYRILFHFSFSFSWYFHTAYLWLYWLLMYSDHPKATMDKCTKI